MAQSDSFYNDIVTEVEAILEEFGAEYTIRTQSQLDPVTFAETPGSTRTAFGVVNNSEIGSTLAMQLNAIASTNNENNAKAVLLLSPTAAPQALEEVMVDGRWYSLGKVKPVRPADVTVLYTLELAS